MCSKNCCGTFNGILLLALAVAACATPWYFEFYTRNESGHGQCGFLYMQGVKDIYCRTDCKVDIQGCTDTTAWRDSCANIDPHVLPTTAGSCSKTKLVMDYSVGAVAGAALLALLSLMGFIRNCCKGHHEKHTWMVAVNILGLLAVLAVCISFPLNFQNYVRDEYNCGPANDTGSCSKSFWGSKGLNNGQGVTNAVWGPGGWAVAAVSIIFWIISLSIACAPTVVDPSYGVVVNRYDSYQLYDQNGNVVRYG